MYSRTSELRTVQLSEHHISKNKHLVSITQTHIRSSKAAFVFLKILKLNLQCELTLFYASHIITCA